jgi:NAD(P)-dependent dehydrogenase (short-subunit alcohol dehydrogenase family)
MEPRLTGRCALITGAADGIGLAMARRFAAEGAQVALADLDADRAGDEAAKIGAAARAIRVDVTDRAGVLTMMEEAGPVDILVNNAWAGNGPARIESKDDDLFDRALRMGVWACKWSMEGALPHMKAQRWGRVINIASLNGVNAHMGTAEYNSSKEALRAYTRTAAREWAGWGITCNIICPAAKSSSFRRMEQRQPEMIAAIEKANPMGRMGDPDMDIAPIAAFLASDEARYLTGNTLFADGGGHINGVAWTPDLGD